MAARPSSIMTFSLLCWLSAAIAAGSMGVGSLDRQRLRVEQSLESIMGHASTVARGIEQRLAAAVPDAAAAQMVRRLQIEWVPRGRKLTAASEDPVCEWDDDWEDCNLGSSFLDSLGMPTALKDTYDTLSLNSRCKQFKIRENCIAYQSGKCLWHGQTGDLAACRAGGDSQHHLYTMMSLFDSTDCGAWGIYLNSVVPCMQIHSGAEECEAAHPVCKWFPAGDRENNETSCPANATQCSDCNATARCIADRSQFQRAFCPTLSHSMTAMIARCGEAPVEPDIRMSWLADCYRPHCGSLSLFLDGLRPVLIHCLMEKNETICDKDPLCVWAVEADGTAFCNYSPHGMLNSIPKTCPYSGLVEKSRTCASRKNSSECSSSAGCAWDTSLKCNGSTPISPTCNLGVSGALEAATSQRDPIKEKLFELVDGMRGMCVKALDNETCSEAVVDTPNSELHTLVLKKIDQIKYRETQHKVQLNGPSGVLTTSSAQTTVAMLASILYLQIILKAMGCF